MISKALQIVWKSAVAASVFAAVIAANAEDAEAKKRKVRTGGNGPKISYVLNAQNKAKAIELLAQTELSRDDTRALQRALGMRGKQIDGRLGPKTAKVIYDFGAKLTLEERTGISPHIRGRLKSLGFSLSVSEDRPNTEVPEPSADFAFLPGVPWDKQIADKSDEISRFLLEKFGDESETLLPIAELEKLKQNFIDLGSMAATAKKAMDDAGDPASSVKHEELSKAYEEYALYARLAATGTKDKPFTGLPAATMGFLKGKSLIYAVQPSLLRDLIKYGQGEELKQSRFEFTNFNLNFDGFDTRSSNGVLTPLTTVGVKAHANDPFTADVMAKFGEHQHIVRQLFDTYKSDWIHLTAGRLPPDAANKAGKCRVVIDPGHGYLLNDNSYDPGAVVDGVSEISPDTERMFYAIALTLEGCDVRFTRFPGYPVPIVSKSKIDNETAKKHSLRVRPSMAVALNAQVLNTDHYNWSGKPESKGEVVYYKGDSPKSQFVGKEMAATLGVPARAETSWNVIRNAPSSIVLPYFERGFLTNAEDREIARRNSEDFPAAKATAFERARILISILKRTPNMNMTYEVPPQAHNVPGLEF